MNFIKKIFSVASGEKVELEGVQLWSVRWESRRGRFDDKPEMEAFTSEEDAVHFAKQLREAFALTKCSYNKNVYIEKQ